MKFVKRISLFFIYPMTMFGIGFLSNTAIQEFFYPGEVVLEETEKVKQQEEPVVETGYAKEAVITANTSYIVLSYDMLKETSCEMPETAPDKYIGLNRESLEMVLKEYNKSPSLTDLEKGFQHAELVSFSPEKVVIQKNYKKQDDGFYLISENHNVMVYDESLKYLYMNTGIRTEDLPEELQNDILHMKYIESESELYHFLESYSS